MPTPSVAVPGANGRYNISMLEFQASFHRDLPLTRAWGYNATCVSPGESVQCV